MAQKGSVHTDWHQHQRQSFHYSATREGSTRDVKISWWMTTECNDSAASPTYYLCYKSQELIVNGKTEVDWSSSTNPRYTNSKGDVVWRGFTDEDSWLDKNYNKKNFFDTNGDYTGIRRWVQVLGTAWKTGEFTLTADDAGDVSFSVSGKFGWYGKTGLNFSKTFTVSGLVPEKTYSIKYYPNSDDLVSGNSVSNVPVEQTKKYNKDIELSSDSPITKDKNKHTNYTFSHWTKSATSSFKGKDDYYPEDEYTANKDLKLYAIWEPEEKTIKLDLNGGTSPIELSYDVDYNKTWTTPAKNAVTRYGYTLFNWQDSSATTIAPGKDYTCLGNTTLEAQYSANSYTISFAGKDGKIIPNKTITATYDAPLLGDFSYSFPGYKLLGWSTFGVIIKNPGDSALPIIPNIPFGYEGYNQPHIYIGGGIYTSTNQFKINSSTARKHMIGQNITLYPVLEYSTSMYVYTGSKWVLAMPYEYSGSTWKQSLGYIYSSSKWKQ